jgi:hypothetical protein
MSLVHKVIVLNKPLKIRGQTPSQWVMLLLAVGFSFWFSSTFPPTWKFHNVPIGVWAGIGSMSALMVPIYGLQSRPLKWWRNCLLYGMGLLPKLYLPRSEEPVLYPDPTIKEVAKKSTENYMDVEQ